MNRTFTSALLGVLFGCGVLVACGSGATPQPLIIGQTILATAHVQAGSNYTEITRQANHMGPEITVTRQSEGHYILDFGFDVSDRFYSVSPGNTTPSGSVYFALNAFVLPIKFEPTKLAVVLFNNHSHQFTDSGAFFVSVH